MTKTTAPRVRALNLYTVEQDGQPVAQAMAISQAEAVALWIASQQQPVLSARLSTPIEARTLAGLPLLSRDTPASPAVSPASCTSAPDLQEPAAAPAVSERAPPSAKIIALLGDAYRLGLNEAGLPGQIVGKRAYAMRLGLYITDADAVSAEFARGCSDAWKRRQEEVAAAPQGEPVPSAPSTAAPTVSPAPVAAEQATADTELQRQAKVAAERRAMGGKPIALYMDPATGQSWSGRGLKPKWLLAELEAGRTQDEFLIEGAQA